MAGLGETRYFSSSLFDLMIHSQAPPYTFEGEDNLTAAELYRRVTQKYTTLAQLPKTNYSASWPLRCFLQDLFFFPHIINYI
jgi:hypothetical protein